MSKSKISCSSTCTCFKMLLFISYQALSASVLNAGFVPTTFQKTIQGHKMERMQWGITFIHIVFPMYLFHRIWKLSLITSPSKTKSYVGCLFYNFCNLITDVSKVIELLTISWKTVLRYHLFLQ